jgi:hypothetical protein
VIGKVSLVLPDLEGKIERGVAVAVKPLSKMVKRLEKELAVPVRAGQIYQKRIYSTRILRLLGQLSHIPGLAYQAGHTIQEIIGLHKVPAEIRGLADEDAQDKVREGFSAFVRLYVTQPEEALKRAPAFVTEFEARLQERAPTILQRLQDMRGAWKLWQQAPSVPKVTSLIRYGREIKEERRSLKQVFYELFGWIVAVVVTFLSLYLCS